MVRVGLRQDITASLEEEEVEIGNAVSLNRRTTFVWRKQGLENFNLVVLSPVAV